MGAPKQKWTSEEEGALRAGVEKYGAGKWRTIQKDPEFGLCLAARSNVDLKDKWRNMSVSASGQGSREKVKTPRIKALAAVPYANNASESTPPVLAIEASAAASPDNLISPRSSTNGKTISPRYDDMIIEALLTMKDPNGTDVGTIASFIEERHELPSNFRRLLGSKLRRLVNQEKIVKVRNNYMLKDVSSTIDVKPTILGPWNQTDNSRQHQSTGSSISTDSLSINRINEASMAAAIKMADAEAMSAIADEAAKESEFVSRLAEETDLFFEAATAVFEQLLQDGVIVLA